MVIILKNESIEKVIYRDGDNRFFLPNGVVFDANIQTYNWESSRTTQAHGLRMFEACVYFGYGLKHYWLTMRYSLNSRSTGIYIDEYDNIDEVKLWL